MDEMLHVDRYFAIRARQGNRPTYEIAIWNGLLLDPQDPHERVFPGVKELLAWSSLEHFPCVVLLGEPGRGKSTEWRFQHSAIEANGYPRKSFLIDLRDPRNRGRLGEAVSAVETYLCEHPDACAAVFVDSLDEAMLTNPNIDSELVMAIQSLPLDRLQLRIACRPADWPPGLEQELGAIYGDAFDGRSTAESSEEDDADPASRTADGEEHVTAADRNGEQRATGGREQARWAIVQLCPLRDRDVKVIVAAAGIESPDQFMEAMENAESRPIAADPVTLNALVELFGKEERLPHARTELYERMIEELLAEPSPGRRDAARFNTGPLRARDDVGARLRRAVAQRIAALMIFGKRAAINVRADGDEGLLRRRDLEGCNVSPDLNHRSNAHMVTLADIEAVLDTRLFAGAGSDTFVFAHRSYAEYLAASAIRDWHLSRIQLLLTHPDDPQRRVVPQMREAAAWLASLNPDFRDWILRHQPDILAEADPAAVSQALRPQLCEALMEHVGQPGVDLWKIDWSHAAARLQHSGLGEQLLPYMAAAADGSQREAAFLLAWAVPTPDIHGDLADIANDAAHDVRARVHALTVLERHCEDSGICTALEPLAELDAANDVGERLKGAALRVLFPRFWNAERLCRALRPLTTGQRRSGATDGYVGFLRHELPKRLLPEHVPALASWLAGVARPVRRPQIVADYGGLPTELFMLGWLNMDQPGIVDALAELVIAFAARRISVWEGTRPWFPGDRDPQAEFREEFSGNAARRKLLSESILHNQPEEPERPHQSLLTEFDFERNPQPAVDCLLVQSCDFDWLVELAPTLTYGGKVIAYSWLRALLSEPGFRNLARVEAFMSAIEADEARDQLRVAFLDGVAVREPRAPAEGEEARPRSSISERLVPLLEKARGGHAGCACQIIFEIGAPEGHLEYDWSRWRSRWDGLELGLREEVLSALEAFFPIGPVPEGVDPHETTDYVYLSGLAFRWFVVQRHGWSNSPPEVWNRWLEVAILTMPSDDQREFLDLIWEQHRAAIEAVVVAAVRKWLNAERERALRAGKDSTSGNHAQRVDPGIASHLQRRLGTALADLALEFLCGEPLPAEAESWCVETAARNRADEVVQWIAQHISPAALTDPESAGHEAAARRVQTLIRLKPERAWDLLMEAEVLEREHAFVELVGEFDRAHELLGKLRGALDLDQIEAVLMKIPATTPPWRGGSYGFGPHGLTWEFHRACADRAVEFGTRAAVEVFRRLSKQDIQPYPFLPSHLRAAEEAWLRKSWPGKRPEDANALLERMDARTIDSARELFDLVLELLEDIGRSMSGQISLVESLWEPDGRGSVKPRRERALQAFLKNQLTLLLRNWPIVADREVQIGSQGETDLLVTAVTRCQDQVKVVIEVKLQDHRSVNTAMETQLVDGYMQDSELNHGIYLVGWYACPKWKPEIEARMDATREGFEDQARELMQRHADRVQDLRAVVLDCRYPIPASART